jgi:uncharacterized Fe-S cluster-containing radical SAM superfamily protein
VSPPIDTDAFSTQMRDRGADAATRRLRISSLTGSEQERDLSEPANCQGLGRIRHFRRSTADGWPPNPLPIEPATRALGLGATDTLEAQVFQNAVCNWRCWYCYVPFELLSGRSDRSELISADELVDRYLAEANPPQMIDLSGGQPDLVPEWIAWTIDALERRGALERTYLWSDDNLSTDYFFTRLSAKQRETIEKQPRYGKVCCFKGFDADSFAFNTLAAPDLFDRQFALMRRLVTETTLDLYAYATFTAPETAKPEATMASFVDRLQDISVELPLRTVPLRVGLFTPVHGRRPEAQMRSALEAQETAIAAWNQELERRFTVQQRARSICDAKLRH